MYVQCLYKELPTDVYQKGGAITYSSNVTDQVNSAVADFSMYNTDPKAGIIITYGYELGSVSCSIACDRT